MSMSVLIKGMEMPKNCWECHFGNGETGNCLVDFKSHGEWDEPQNCPLVQVPPHGALIDRNDLFATCPELVDGYKQITDDLVVIPAEEGEA